MKIKELKASIKGEVLTAEKLVLLNKDSLLIKNYNDGILKIKSVLQTVAKNKASLLSQQFAFEQSGNENIISSYLSSNQLTITGFTVLQIEYYSNCKAETKKRKVEPFAVINRIEQSWYVIAWCRSRKASTFFDLTELKC